MRAPALFSTTGRRSIFLALLLSTFLSAACGKIGDPLPPIPRAPLTVTELTAVQQGSRIILSFPFTRPARARRLSRVEIYRLIEPNTAPAGLPAEDFSSRATFIEAIPADQIPAGKATITYVDSLGAQASGFPNRYRYAVRLIDADGRSADFSNYAILTPLIDLAKPPTNLQSTVTQNELTITWTPPTSNEAGGGPVNLAGYNIYRLTGETPVKLNAQPLTEPRFVERSFQFGTPYQYFARSVSRPPGNSNIAEAIESDPSATLTVTPRDTFPPAAPEAIRIASINGLVSLFWPSNAEADLAGYHIYRSEDDSAPPEQWLKLTPRVHTPTTFRDEKVVVGKRYFYQLTAVDTAGNESARSAPIGEVVNP